jgi:hypothetical protein
LSGRRWLATCANSTVGRRQLPFVGGSSHHIGTAWSCPRRSHRSPRRCHRAGAERRSR